MKQRGIPFYYEVLARKIVQTTIVVVLALGMVGITGCYRCVECYSFHAHFICQSGSDTSFFQVDSYNMLNDSLGYYNNLGFACDTLSFIHRPHDNSLNSTPRPYCGSKKDINEFSYQYDKCVEAGKQAFPF